MNDILTIHLPLPVPAIKTISRCSLLALLFLLSACPETESQKEWNAFKVQHHCRITAKIDPTTRAWGPRGPVDNPAMDGWTCDDAITYFKEHKDDAAQ